MNLWVSIQYTKRNYTRRTLSSASEGAAAYDLWAECSEPIYISRGGLAVVPTGVSLDLHEGYAGLVCSRSGLASGGVFVLNAPGIIDSDYRGEIKVILASLLKDWTIQPGDRIAQLLIVHALNDVVFVEDKPLTETARGADGFGSTGR